MSPFSTLTGRMPGLDRLSLEDNSIHSYKDLEFIKDLNLVELRIQGNPIVEKEIRRRGGEVGFHR